MSRAAESLTTLWLSMDECDWGLPSDDDDDSRGPMLFVRDPFKMPRFGGFGGTGGKMRI